MNQVKHLIIYCTIALTLSGCFLNSTIGDLGNGTSTSNPATDSKYDFPDTLAVAEGSSASVTFKLSGNVSAPVNIYYDVIDGSAVAGTNYLYASGSFTLSGSQTEKIVNVSTLNILMPEGQKRNFKIIWKTAQDANSSPIGTTDISITGRPDILISDLGSLVFARPSKVLDLGTYFLYTYNDGTTGTELWRSDGTAPGTFLLADLCPGVCSTDFFDLEKIGSTIFFSFRKNNKFEIWKTDGTTSGTQLALTGNDLGIVEGLGSTNSMQIQYAYVGNQFSGAHAFLAFNGKLVIPGYYSGGFSAYISDGTLAGTQKLGPLFYSSTIYFAANSNYIFFNNGNLLATNGTPGSMNLVNVSSAFMLSSPVVIDGGFAYTTYMSGVNTYRPVRSDGTVAGTTVISNASALNLFGGAVVYGGKAYYTHQSMSPLSTELWAVSSTGTTGAQVFSINEYASVNFLGTIGTNLVYLVNKSTGSAVYITDGTAAGTTKLMDIAGSAPTYISSVAQASNRVLFSMDALPPPYPTLWITDGTVGGTGLASTFFSSKGLTDIAPIYFDGSSFFFSAKHASYGREVWKTDLTVGGTQIVRDHVAGTESSKLSYLMKAMGGLWFSEPNPAQKSGRLVKIDPTSGNATYGSSTFFSYTSLFSAYDSSGTITNTPPSLVASGDFFYFLGSLEGNSRGIYKLDPTNNVSTRMGNLEASDVHVGTVGTKLIFGCTMAGSCPTNAPMTIFDSSTNGLVTVPGLTLFTYPAPLSLNNKIFFTAMDATTGREAWISDGTSSGTMSLGNLVPGAINTPVSIAVLNNVGYIGTPDSLYKTDGTPAGTQLVLSPPFTSYPKNIVNLSTKIVFVGQTAANGFELWQSDGTAAGTSMILDIGPSWSNGTSWGDPLVKVGGKIFFIGNDGTNGSELWITDGTTAGTTMVKDIVAGSGSPSITAQIALGSKLIFTAQTAAEGRELWVSDGTSAGTFILADLCAGACSSTITGQIIFKNKLYFWQTVSNGASNTASVLWQTDGTVAGTTQVADIRPYLFSSGSFTYSTTDRFIYFTAKNLDATAPNVIWRTEGTNGGITQALPNNPGTEPLGFSVKGAYMVFTQMITGVGQVITVVK